MSLLLVANDNQAVLSRQITAITDEHKNDYADVFHVKPQELLETKIFQPSLFAEPKIFVIEDRPGLGKELESFSEEIKSTEDFLIIRCPKPTAALKKIVTSLGGEIKESLKKNYLKTGEEMLAKSTLPANVKNKILSEVGQDIERIPAIVEILETLPPANLKYDTVVSAYIGEPGEVPLWGILDAIDSQQPTAGLRVLARTSQAPVAIQAAIQAHLERLFILQQTRITTGREAGEFFNVKGSLFPYEKALRVLPRYKGQVEPMLALTVDAGAKLRGGSPLDARLVLELLIGQLCTFVGKR